MQRVCLTIVAALAVSLFPAGASADVTMEGTELSCIPTDGETVFSATTSGGVPHTVKLWFYDANGDVWWAPMTEEPPGSGQWFAKLPKINMDSITYYYEADGQPTQEFTAQAQDDCDNLAAAPAGLGPAVLTGGPGVAAAAPAGLAAGGLFGPAAVAGGIAGATAAGVGINELTGGDESPQQQQ